MLDALKKLLPSRAEARPPTPGAAFMRGERAPVFAGWHPALRSSRDDVRAAWRLATSRAVDMIQNSGWLAGGVMQSTAAVVGAGLQLTAKPDAAAIGMTETEASQWARRVERRFETWANNPRACDAGGRFTLGQIGAQAYRHWLATGEVLATFPWFALPGSTYRTKIKLLPAWQMSTTSEGVDLVQGVRLAKTGAPIAYRLKQLDAWGGTTEIEIPAFDPAGRPIVAHIFDGEPSQVRGITPLVPILKVARQFDQLADGTLTAALIQAIFAATLTSDGASDEALESLRADGENNMLAKLNQARGGWYSEVDISLDVHGKIANLFPGDKLEFLRSEHPNSTYEPFARFLLRECSRVLALTYEEYTGDFAGATYSSIKMGTAVIWPRVLYLRKNVPARLHQIAYEAWLEEDIEAGGTPFPGGVRAYLAKKDAAARADWRGPAKPQADDLKAAKAAETLKAMGVVSDEMICADLGVDVDDVYEQRRREKDRRADLGLEDAEPATDPVADALLSEDAKSNG